MNRKIVIGDSKRLSFFDYSGLSKEGESKSTVSVTGLPEGTTLVVESVSGQDHMWSITLPASVVNDVSLVVDEAFEDMPDGTGGKALLAVETGAIVMAFDSKAELSYAEQYQDFCFMSDDKVEKALGGAVIFGLGGDGLAFVNIVDGCIVFGYDEVDEYELSDDDDDDDVEAEEIG